MMGLIAPWWSPVDQGGVGAGGGLLCLGLDCYLAGSRDVAK